MKINPALSFFSLSLCAFVTGPYCPSAAASLLEHHGFSVEESNESSCIECHSENAPGQNNGLEKTSGCTEINQLSHPIHRAYPPEGRESRFKSRKEAEELGVRFANGKMTCLSCHNLTNEAKGHLAVDNYNSRLCMACHKM